MRGCTSFLVQKCDLGLVGTNFAKNSDRPLCRPCYDEFNNKEVCAAVWKTSRWCAGACWAREYLVCSSAVAHEAREWKTSCARNAVRMRR